MEDNNVYPLYVHSSEFCFRIARSKIPIECSISNAFQSRIARCSFYCPSESSGHQNTGNGMHRNHFRAYDKEMHSSNIERCSIIEENENFEECENACFQLTYVCAASTHCFASHCDVPQCKRNTPLKNIAKINRKNTAKVKIQAPEVTVH